MHKTARILTRFVALAAFTQPVLASEWLSNVASSKYLKGLNVGASFGIAQADSFLPSNAVEENVRMQLAEISLGYQYHPLLGIDLRYGSGIGDDETEVTGTDNAVISNNSYGLDTYDAIYYRAEYANEYARIYALLGSASVELTSDVETGSGASKTIVSNTESTSVDSYGIGVGWFTGEHSSIDVELRSFSGDNNVKMRILSVGVDYRF